MLFFCHIKSKMVGLWGVTFKYNFKHAEWDVALLDKDFSLFLTSIIHYKYPVERTFSLPFPLTIFKRCRPSQNLWSLKVKSVNRAKNWKKKWFKLPPFIIYITPPPFHTMYHTQGKLTIFLTLNFLLKKLYLEDHWNHMKFMQRSCNNHIMNGKLMNII